MTPDPSKDASSDSSSEAPRSQDSGGTPSPETPHGKLSRKEFLGYAVGFIGPMCLLSLVNVLLQLYYIYVIGLDPLLSGIGLTIGLLTYSIFALVWGQVSDNNTGTLAKKYGKRKPFLFGALVPIIIIFFLMWVPPVKPTVMDEKNWSTAIWLWVTSGLFHLSFSAFSSSYWALMPEISHDEDERLRLSMTQNLVNLIGTVVSILIPIVLLAGADWDESLFYYDAGGGSTAGQHIVDLMVVFSIIFMVLTVASVMVTVVTVREPPLPEKLPEKKSLVRFFKEIFVPLRDNPEFAKWQTANFMVNLAGRLLLLDVMIFVRIVLKLEGIEWGVFVIVLVAVGGGSFLWFDKMKQRKGLKPTFMVALIIGTVVTISAVLFFVDIPKPASFWLGLVFMGFAIVGVIGIMVFPMPINSSMVDKGCALSCVDRSELAGKYSGINLFFIYISSAIASLVYSGILEALGPESRIAIVLALPVSGLFLLASLLIFRRVDLSIPKSAGKSPVLEEAAQ